MTSYQYGCSCMSPDRLKENGRKTNFVLGISMGNVPRLHRPPQNRLELSGFVAQIRLIIFVSCRFLLPRSPGSA